MWEGQHMQLGTNRVRLLECVGWRLPSICTVPIPACPVSGTTSFGCLFVWLASQWLYCSMQLTTNTRCAWEKQTCSQNSDFSPLHDKQVALYRTGLGAWIWSVATATNDLTVGTQELNRARICPSQCAGFCCDFAR